jgi:restriction system protein
MGAKGLDQGIEFLKWFGPLLDALRDLGGSANTREAIEAVAKRMDVTDEERQITLKSGVERFSNQVRWARQYLVWEGLVDASKRGVWSLTPKGLGTHLSLDDAKLIHKKLGQRIRGKQEGGTESEFAKPLDQPADTPQSDDETDLARYLSVLGGLSAKGFEHYCLRLLREAGFERLEVTGRSNDGGVDGEGVLQVNDLVSFNVVFQCKKWQGAVPPKEVRDLRGAMAGRAEKGIFLTTSRFTSNARNEAERAGASQIELVDGEKLFEMAKKYGLGLKPRTVHDIDVAFFEAFK